MFEDLNYEELRRRANAPLPDRVVATLEARGERRTVSVGDVLYRVDDSGYPFVYVVSGSVKRVVSAVGEGSVVVQAVHARLASLRESSPITV